MVTQKNDQKKWLPQKNDLKKKHGYPKTMIKKWLPQKNWRT